MFAGGAVASQSRGSRRRFWWAPLDARAPDDRLEARAELHESLVASVIVGRPEQERRYLTIHAARLADKPFAVEPCADERVRAALVSDCGLLLVAGEDL